MRLGYNGKILHIDLTTGDMAVEQPPEEFYRRYMGGSALNTYYVLKGTPPGVDPLGPQNVLALSVGVTTGAPISGQSRLTVTAKSPLTGAIGDSQGGGFFPAEMKFSGFDAFIIKGKSPKPVYLWVEDGHYELRDASHLWGKVGGEVEDILWKELGDDKIQIAQIGPAAEAGVLFSSVMSMCARANGRTGMGAVMASKNLKAIAVRGKRGKASFQVSDKKQLNELARRGAQAARENMAGMTKYGTAGFVGVQSYMGGLPTRNFTSGVFESVAMIDGMVMFNTMLKGAAEGQQERLGTDTCYGCAVHCKRVVEITNGPYQVDPRYGGPEYETMAALGSYCGVSDLAAVVKANELCNKYGMDTISCGGTIAWAMECFEKGKITLDDTGGIELRFGNAAAMVQMVELIATRQGFGNVLALGSQRAAGIIGHGTDEYLVTCRGQEFPAHMPRVKVTLGLIYAVNPFGADHMSSTHDPSYQEGSPLSEGLAMLGLTTPQPARALNAEKVRFARITQYFASLTDSLNICQFIWGAAAGLYGPKDTVDMVRYVTGWDVTLDELIRVGERRVNMMRAFNAREGLDRKQDRLPTRMFQPLVGGPSDGFALEQQQIEAAFEEYYRQSGWDVESGNPKRAKLEELDLAWVADELGL